MRGPENNRRHRKKVEEYQKISKTMKNNHPCPLQNSQRGAAVEARRPPLGGGRKPPVKNMDDIFSLFCIYF